MAEATHCAVLAAGLQAEYTKSLGDNKLLDFVVWGRNTLKNLEALESGSSAGSLVGNHATDGLVENPGGCAEMEGTTPGRVVTCDLAQVVVVLDLSTEELAGDVEFFAAHYDDLLTVEELLGNNTGKTAEKMAFAINDHDFLEG